MEVGVMSWCVRVLGLAKFQAWLSDNCFYITYIFYQSYFEKERYIYKPG